MARSTTFATNTELATCAARSDGVGRRVAVGRACAPSVRPTVPCRPSLGSRHVSCVNSPSAILSTALVVSRRFSLRFFTISHTLGHWCVFLPMRTRFVVFVFIHVLMRALVDRIYSPIQLPCILCVQLFTVASVAKRLWRVRCRDD